MSSRLGWLTVLAFGAALASLPPPSAANAQPIRFTGERIDLELQAAALDDVLRLFSDIGKVNIIKKNDVRSGPITAKFEDVRWDKALYLILQSQGLQMTCDGNVIYVHSDD